LSKSHYLRSIIFKELTKSNIFRIRIGIKEQISMKGKRTIVVKIHLDVKFIFEVLYVVEIN